MKQLITRSLLAGSLITLAACGGGSGNGVDKTNSNTLSVVTAYGEIIQTDNSGLDSTISTRCYVSNNPSNGIKETMALTDTTWTYNLVTYAGDTSCSGSGSAQTIVANITVDQDVQTSGWIDGQEQALATPPGKASYPTTALPSLPPYTRINLEVTQSSYPGVSPGLTTNFGFVIDDSFDGSVVLYRVNQYGFVTDADPYTNVVSNGYFSEQNYAGTRVDKYQSSLVHSYYDSTVNTSVINMRYKEQPNASQLNYIQLRIPGNLVIRNYTNANSISVTANLFTANEPFVINNDPENYINITNAGVVGEKITGTYKLWVCHASGCIVNGSSTKIPLQGEFKITRNPDL